MTRPTVTEKRLAFRRLHESGCFVIPNPWDVGSALYLQRLGFPALATTSAGAAWSRGRPDGGLTREAMLDHFREIVDATDIPVNADFEGGFANDPAGVAESVRLAVETGVAGLSIEDFTGSAGDPIYDIATAVERLRAARRAIDAAGGDTLLVGRAEGFRFGRTDLAETIARLTAYASAGADCLYAPAVRDPEHIRALVRAVHPKPLNLLVGWASDLTMADIEALGVRRVSVGGALARAAWGGFLHAATTLAEAGRFDGFAAAAAGSELDTCFREDARRRE